MLFPHTKLNDFDTPCYYYDLSVLRETLNLIKEATSSHPNYHVHYAVKANVNPRLLQLISERGFGADCVSGGEIEAAIASGFPANKIVFAGVGKNDDEIRLALTHGIQCFNVESLPELEVINELAASMDKVATIAFRVNPNIDAHTNAKITTGLNENKFGIAMEDMLPAIKKAQALKNVDYVGLHFHIGSQITDMAVFEHLCERINELQDELDKAGITTRSINVGGGLGIDYTSPLSHPFPDFYHYFDVFANNLKLRKGQELHFELGRSIVAQCGALLARTLYVKEGHAKKFIIIDAGFTDLVRPAMYGARHCPLNLSAPAGSPTDTYDIVGPICESSDVFSTGETLPLTRRGDYIVFYSTGAYGEVMASTYNCRKLPKVYFSE